MVNDESREAHNDARRKKTTLYDLVVVGGGLIGKTLALALAHTSLKIAIIEATPPGLMASSDFDARSIALSLSSQRILDSLQVWQALKSYAEPIAHIHVSQEKGFSATRLQASEHGYDAFGYVAELHALNKVFQEKLSDRVKQFSPATLTALKKESDYYELTFKQANETQQLRAKLVVAADGANSTVRQLLQMPAVKKSYGQSALVANVGLNRSHKQVAYERFMGKELMALLPMKRERASLVWAQSPDKAKERQSLSEKAFLALLQSQFGYRLGRFISIGNRQTFPLSFCYMPKTVNGGVVFLGNAAHGLHPIAGQGFNLGLRDAAILAEVLVQEGVTNLSTSLSHYQAKRQRDQSRVTYFTDALIRLFTSPLPGFSFLRDVGLGMMELTFPLKETFVQYAAGFSAENARLAAGLTLEAHDQNA